MEVVVPFLILGGVTLGFVVDELQNSASENITELLDQTTILVVLSRDVQWQVLTIDHSLHKPQITGQQLLAFLFNQHLSRVQIDVRLFLTHTVFFLMRGWDIKQSFNG